MKNELILIATLSALPATAQQNTTGADPYRNGHSTETADATTAQPDHNPPVNNISTCYEVFSVPLATAARLRREGLGDQELYKRLVEAVEDESAKQEAFVVVRSRSGERATSKGISEYTYPTRYEPAELPNTVGVSIIPKTGKDAPPTGPDAHKLDSAPASDMFSGLATPSTGTSFQTRDLGVSLEIEATLGPDNKIVDLRIAPQHVTLAGRNKWGQLESTLEVPDFEVQSIHSGITARLDRPQLLSTLNRPPNSKTNPDSADRIWFAYVTVSLQKP